MSAYKRQPIRIVQSPEFSIRRGEESLGWIRRWGGDWAAGARDKHGNHYGLGDFKTKKRAVQAVLDWHKC